MIVLVASSIAPPKLYPCLLPPINAKENNNPKIKAQLMNKEQNLMLGGLQEDLL